MADAVIRLLDFVGVKGYDIPENYITEEQIKNEADEVKEWMINKTFADVVFSSCLVKIESAKEIPEALMYYIFVVAELYGIDLICHIKEKMMYNETRKMMHNNFVKSADMYFREFAGMIFNESTKMIMFADMESLDAAFRVWS